MAKDAKKVHKERTPGITATQRDPSQFEYVLSSSAPAILSRGRSKREPSESAAVSNLIAMSHANAIDLDSERQA
jgi:hypothetical protein